MRRFIKYEIRENYKFILGIFAIVVLASTIIQVSTLNQMKLKIEGPLALLAFISMFVILGSFLVAFINIVGSFRKELYENRGYLTFSLPITGYQILGAKLVVAFLSYIILGLAIVVYNVMLATFLFKLEWSSIFNFFYQLKPAIYLALIPRVIISSIIGGLISVIFTLIFIYFSMTLGKVGFRNIKIGGLWFIIFLVIFSIINLSINQIASTIPLYLNLETLKLSNIAMPVMIPPIQNFTSSISMGYSGVYNINITQFILTIILSIMVFIATGYLIEKKIDL